MKKESFFSIFFLTLLGIIFLIVAYYSSQDSWNVPDNAKWATGLMLNYLYFTCFRTILLLGLSFYEYLNAKMLPDISYPPLVTIIIPCYNEEKVIQESIRSAMKVDYPNLEILVVDDGSIDDTFERAVEMSEHFRVRVITKYNGGKANALNYGISQALGEYIFCMDADSSLDKNVLKASLPYFKLDKNLAAVAGTVNIGNHNSLITKFQVLEYTIGLNFHKQAQSALNMVTIVPGPVGIFKKSVLLEVGGYDEDTFAEDCDLTLKILSYGYHIKYSPNMIATTEAPTSFYELSIQRYRWSRGTIQAIVKHLGNLKEKKRVSRRNLLIFFYMTIETIIIPSVNFLFAMLTLTFALYFENVHIYGPFFLGLILVDVAVVLYSIFTDKKLLSLFVLSVFSRFTFGFALEIMRFYSMVDEIIKVPMKWGKLTRKGID